MMIVRLQSWVKHQPINTSKRERMDKEGQVEKIERKNKKEKKKKKKKKKKKDKFLGFSPRCLLPDTSKALNQTKITLNCTAYIFLIYKWNPIIKQ